MSLHNRPQRAANEAPLPDLTLPLVPKVPERWSFPVVGSVAPLAVSVGMWLVTQSPLALVFAVFGPVLAVGSYVDARMKSRATRRRENIRFEFELRRCSELGKQLHDGERSSSEARLPAASRIVAGEAYPQVGWGVGPRRELEVNLGRGVRASTIDPRGVRPASAPESPAEMALARLLNEVCTLRDAPIALRVNLDSGSGGVGIFGQEPLAVAYARALLIQLVRVLSPSHYCVSINPPAPAWEWLNELPHQIVPAPQTSFLEGRTEIRISPTKAFSPPTAVPFVSLASGRAAPTVADNSRAVVIVIARNRSELPGELDAIISLDTGPTAGPAAGPNGSRGSHRQHRVVHHRSGAGEGDISLDVVSLQQASQWARSISVLAQREGFIERDSGAIPETVLLSELLARTPFRGGHALAEAGLTTKLVPAPAGAPNLSSLACSFLVSGRGDEIVDLVADGPHAVIGGTTGSGKSELLISWVTAIAARYRWDEVNFLLVDYKGGASFGSLIGLPHCVGMLTDLDAAASTRALESLAAELRFREAALASSGVKSIAENPQTHGLARLVIVVDEFAAMASEHPELHQLFSDIAARGRSLGVHLILCTQRPAGVIREAVLANSALRISLRVNNRADSAAVIGDDGAASLPAKILGRAILVRSGEPALVVQCALAGSADIAGGLRQRLPGRNGGDNGARGSMPRRPWLNELSDRITVETVLGLAEGEGEETIGTSIAFGLADYPEEQRQPVARYRPNRDGHLLIVGQSRSGKTTALGTMAHSAVAAGRGETVLVPPGVEALWDLVTEELARVRESPRASCRLLLMDDVDAVLARSGVDHERELTERLVQLLREGPAVGLYVVVTMRRSSGSTSAIANLMGERLLLPHSSRQEFMMAGGDGQLFRPRMPPGRGQWHEHVTQVAASPSPFAGSAGSERDSARRGSSGDEPARSVPFAPRDSFAMIAPDVPAAVARLRARFLRMGQEYEILELGTMTSPNDVNLSITTGARPRVIVGNPESWQSQWGVLGRISNHSPVVFDGCTVSDYRALTRSRIVPPPLDNSNVSWWLLLPGLPVARAHFDEKPQLPS